jgi:outer membrane protein TolC
MKTITHFSVLFMLGTGLNAQASETKNFSEIWNAIKAEHPELMAAKAEVNAAESSSARSARHWLPGLYFSGRGYSTNDPLQNFMGKLEQRSVTALDFNPDALNQPGSNTFAQLSLGAELPIYEGGGSHAFSEMQDFNLKARQSLNSAAEIEVYTQVVSLYSGVLNANESLVSLEELKTKVNGILSKYSLGSRSNPIGYSGLLGLKSILNRIEASMNEIKLSKINGQNEMLTRSKKINPEWQPQKEKLSQLLSVVLPDQALKEEDESYSMLANTLFTEMQNSKVSMQKSRFLPQLGLFAEGNYFLGDRTTATGYVGGVYLKWAIFNPKDFGLVTESKYAYAAAQSKAASHEINEKLARESSIQILATLRDNEKLLENSSELMNEQVLTASRLFQSGSLNVLQMVEVFNRRADLILQLHELHQKQIQTRVQLARMSRMKGVQL